MSLNGLHCVSDTQSSLTWFNEEVHYMDVTHTGSSMKWRTALMVLHSKKEKKSEWGYCCSYCISSLFFFFNGTNFQNRISVGLIRTSALTSSFLCNNNWTSSALRLKMAWTRGGYKTIKIKYMQFRYTLYNLILFIFHLTWWRHR